MDVSLEHARRLDAADPLARFRARFHFPANAPIYLDGNSLGLLSTDAEQSVLRVLDEWKTLGIGGWLEGAPPWFTLAESLAARVAPLIGADAGEVAVTNSTTVNLHQLLGTLYDPKPGETSAGARTKILAFGGEFPSDLYAIQSHLRLRGIDPAKGLVLIEPDGSGWIDEEEVCDIFRRDTTVQMAILPAVVYTTGQLLDIGRIAQAGRAAGVVTGFDLSHSIGAVAHALSSGGADFAFWCHYKYLNAGPGAVGGLYLNARHAGRPPGLAGWWGSDKAAMFDMAREMSPARGAGGLQVGTPPVLAMAALDGSLKIVEEAGVARLREKSLRLTEYLMELVEASLAPAYGFAFANPREGRRRGGHVSLMHEEAARICRALKDAGVVTDFRPPNIVRIAPVPLYNSFEDCHAAVERLWAIMRERTYREYPAERALVP